MATETKEEVNKDGEGEAIVEKPDAEEKETPAEPSTETKPDEGGEGDDAGAAPADDKTKTPVVPKDDLKPVEGETPRERALRADEHSGKAPQGARGRTL